MCRSLWGGGTGDACKCRPLLAASARAGLRPLGLRRSVCQEVAMGYTCIGFRVAPQRVFAMGAFMFERCSWARLLDAMLPGPPFIRHACASGARWPRLLSASRKPPQTHIRSVLLCLCLASLGCMCACVGFRLTWWSLAATLFVHAWRVEGRAGQTRSQPSP